MDWLLLAALGIMWAAFLIPVGRTRLSPKTSVHQFEYGMELLAQVDTHQGSSGRWIVTPRKGTPFLGNSERKRARARERRRRVFVFLLESIGILFLIGLVPPLRSIFWTLTLGLGAVLVVYIWFLLWIKRSDAMEAREAHPHRRARAARAPEHLPGAAPIGARYVAEGPSNYARATYNGLDSLNEGDLVHVVVHSAGSLAGA